MQDYLHGWRRNLVAHVNVDRLSICHVPLESNVRWTRTMVLLVCYPSVWVKWTLMSLSGVIHHHYNIPKSTPCIVPWLGSHSHYSTIWAWRSTSPSTFSLKTKLARGMETGRLNKLPCMLLVYQTLVGIRTAIGKIRWGRVSMCQPTIIN